MSNKIYSYEEAYNETLKYFENDQLATEVFLTKYALRDNDGNLLEKTPADMHRRLAKEFARIEKKYPNPMNEDEIFGLLDHFKYVVPQGSPLSGIGNNFQLQSISNCFVVETGDSYGAILKTDQELAQIFKRRGGCGVDISPIRPKGMVTSNAAKTTDGIAPFMNRFSNTCREVATEGRRGAEMQTISVHHPEILTFINIKKDKTKVTGANISIRLTGEFMNAVKQNVDYEQRWPVDSKEPKISKMIPAKQIWDEIISAAWSCAEPGLMFWDNIISNSPADSYKKYGFETISTNPCQPAWATVLTPNGISTLGKVKIGDIIWSGKQWTKITNKVCTGVKNVFAYRTHAGIFYGTEQHQIVSNGEKIEVDNASSIDICTLTDISKNHLSELNEEYKLAIMDGLVIGDGIVHKATSLSKSFLIIGQNDQDYFDSEIKDLIVEHRPGIKPGTYDVKTTVTSLPKTYERCVPNEYKFGDINKKRFFLRGLYSANGSIVANRVTLKASSLKIIEDVQLMLSSLGIASYYTTNKAHDVEFENGVYECKQSYDLSIGTHAGRNQFNNLIGFIQKYKNEKLEKICNKEIVFAKGKTTFDIVEKEFIAEEPVFDITVEAEEHTYWSGGLLISNCSELPLGIFDACRLLVINTIGYVINPFTKEATFNWKLFEEHSKKAQRLMDDIVDLELEQIDKIIAKVKSDPESEEIKLVELNLWKKIREKCELGRRTGLGPTAIGDMIAALGMKYSTDESIAFVEQVYKTLALSSYRSSIEMAKERGPFPIFNHKLEKDNLFLNRLWQVDKELFNDYLKYGRRNIANLTTAPAGSISTLTQTTSGIEPAYLLSYKRRRKVNSNEKNVKVDFVDDLGDKWQEYIVYHHGLQNWMNITKEKDITKSPYFGATSNDIDWKKSVDLQAGAQKWVDHAISRTCNLPSDATKEIVGEVYMRAWEAGCKGITVYRDGSRSGVLISTEDKNTKTQFKTCNAPKRPKELPCDIHQVKIKGEAWTIIVGLYDKRPYEVFGGLSKFVEIPKKYKTGILIKNNKDKEGNSIYSLTIGEKDDAITIKDITNVFENVNYGAQTRLLSLCLRHGTPVNYLVEQLQKDKHSDMQSFVRVISRVLKEYVPENTKASGNCPGCNDSNSLIFQEGCIRCTKCAYSKCG